MTNTNLDVDIAIHGDPRQETYHSGDAGRGTFELWCRNRVLIREPGNPSYTLKSRHWYRNGAGQNVSCLNGVPPGISFEYQSQLPAWYYACQHGTWECLGEAGARYTSHGWSRLGSPITLTRTWCWRDATRLALEERIHGDGTYRFTTNLHLGDAPWERAGASAFTCPIEGSQVLMKLTLPENSLIEILPARFAPEYGVEQEGRTLRISANVSLPLTWSVEWEFRS